jgi:DNA-binding transcriptional LysR family regulator
MDRLVGLEVFVSIVESGGFSRAAARLGMSPAMVSTHLARLEERLGARLINRTTRRFDLTQQGQQFLEDARFVLSTLDEAESAVGRAEEGPSGRVRIDTPGAMGLRLVVPALTAFRARHPGIVLDLCIGDRGTVFRTEGFDIVIRVGEARTGGFAVTVLGRTRFVQVASPAYLQRCGVPTTLAELEQHDALVYATVDHPTGRRWRFWRDGETHWMRPRSVAAFNHGDAISAAAVAGVGVAQTLDVLVGPEIADGRLVPILTEWNHNGIPIQMIIPEDRAARPAVAAVAEFLRTQIDWSADGLDRPA